MSAEPTPPDLHAMADQALAAIMDSLRGEIDGVVLIFEIDGRGAVIAADLPDDVILSALLARAALETDRRGQ